MAEHSTYWTFDITVHRMFKAYVTNVRESDLCYCSSINFMWEGTPNVWPETTKISTKDHQTFRSDPKPLDKIVHWMFNVLQLCVKPTHPYLQTPQAFKYPTPSPLWTHFNPFLQCDPRVRECFGEREWTLLVLDLQGVNIPSPTRFLSYCYAI
jgi:hypothetical protein